MRSINSEPMRYLLPILFVALTGCSGFFQPEPANDPEAIFEDLWQRFHDDYAGFESRNVDWDAQYDIFRPMITASTTDEELNEVLHQLLAVLDDGHVSLMTSIDQEKFASNIYYRTRLEDELFDLDLIKTNYLNNNYEQNGNDFNPFGWIGNIGYVHFEFASDNMMYLPDMLDQFADADGLIIDLRHNGGGDFTWALNAMERLTNEKRLVFRSRSKNGPGPDDYTELFDWYLEPGGTYFDKQIVLLTDRYTISAGERATLILDALPNVIHIGDSTNGAFSAVLGGELANGWMYSFAPQQVYFIDGIDYEGTGMIPDILIKNTMDEMAAGIDQNLETALDQF